MPSYNVYLQVSGFNSDACSHDQCGNVIQHEACTASIYERINRIVYDCEEIKVSENLDNPIIIINEIVIY